MQISGWRGAEKGFDPASVFQRQVMASSACLSARSSSRNTSASWRDMSDRLRNVGIASPTTKEPW